MEIDRSIAKLYEEFTNELSYLLDDKITDWIEKEVDPRLDMIEGQPLHPAHVIAETGLMFHRLIHKLIHIYLIYLKSVELPEKNLEVTFKLFIESLLTRIQLTTMRKDG